MSSTGGGSSSQLPLRSALKTDDDADRTPPASGTLKAVQIEEPVPEAPIEDDNLPPKQFPAGLGRRLSGKLPPCNLPASSKASNYEGSPSLLPVDSSSQVPSQQQNERRHHHHHHSEKLLAQVGEWLEHEKARSVARRARRPHRKRKSVSPQTDKGQSVAPKENRQRADSTDSDSSDVGWEKLHRILHDSMTTMGLSSLPSHVPKSPRRRSLKGASRPSISKTASSDTDYVDGDAIVPDCDVWLDNSKTLGYSGGTSNSEEQGGRGQRDREAWIEFKNEIIRTAHTLRLKGWRRVELGQGDSIGVERLSGALTNAVYVVNPPGDIPHVPGRRRPAKLLLRIYGPQAEHLIDRENELKVLQRLARKKIGPRLLGTFKNGRFEQYFNAITLTSSDIRDPETSRQIAKRMRELHDGIELLPHERENGPMVWKNWDQWVDNVERITTYLDKQLETAASGARRNSVITAWRENGYVCGVPWPQFKDMVYKYRAYVESFYKSRDDLNATLVFAHNDTQYGNILRVKPNDEKSPLLVPANKHKQLIVIDFEYAAANVAGLEFANHFTEWTYNYHDATAPHACRAEMYPTIEQQHRFIKAYVDHRPQFPHAGSTPRLSAADSGTGTSSGPSSAVTTPALLPTNSSSSIVDFMLDSRAPPGGWGAAERAREEQTEKQVRELLDETRLWRAGNSALWIAWGIVQAKVPELETAKEREEAAKVSEEDEAGGEEEFDYLCYAQDRAFFFWGDCVQLGLVKPEELPERLRAQLKLVEH